MRNKLTWPLAVALGAAAWGANAAEPGLNIRSAPYWYASLAEGYGRLTSSNVASGGLAVQGAPGTTDQRRSHSDIGATLGYQLTRNLAFEAAYQEIGKFRFSSPVSAGDWRSGGMRLSAVGVAPLSDRISLYARGGVFVSRTKLNVNSPLLDESKTRTNLTVGAGASYAFTSQIDGLLGWDRYQGLGNSQTGKTNADILSVGVRYKF